MDCQSSTINLSLNFSILEAGMDEKMWSVALVPFEEYIDKYQKIEECGRGKFGTVFHVKDRLSEKCYASKHVR